MTMTFGLIVSVVWMCVLCFWGNLKFWEASSLRRQRDILRQAVLDCYDDNYDLEETISPDAIVVFDEIDKEKV